MLRTPLWQEAEKGKPVSLQTLNDRTLLGTEATKSRVVSRAAYAAAGLTGDFKTVEQQDPMLISQSITVKATRIAALVNEPQKRFLEIEETLIVINGDIFENLVSEAMCPTWLYEEMARANTPICGTRTVVDYMLDVLDTETEKRLNDDFNTPRIGNMLCIPIFSGPTKAKPAGDPTLFNVRWLLITSPGSWSREV